ncbi:MAG: hypothetical protein GY762_09380 [Proteobacteria bacterium]|nr:hypothetical protein [Pseudomonadota bacterium]
MSKKYTIITTTLSVLLGLFLSTGCFFDPDPGPDARGDDGFGAEADADADAGVEVEAACPPFVYNSAPDSEDSVTVVGLPGAAPESISQVHVWSDSTTDTAIVQISENDTFAFRIEGLEGDLLFLDMDVTDTAKQLPVVGADNTLEIADIFDQVTVVRQDPETVVVSGKSDLLEEGLWVIGGNVTQIIGTAAPVDCKGECGFSFSIPGDPGDEIDLFLAVGNTCTGLTEAHTETVP